MAEVANIKVNYQANTAEYQKNVEAAKKKTGDFDKTLKGVGKGIKPIDAQQIVGFVKGGLIKDVGEEFEKLGKTLSEVTTKFRQGKTDSSEMLGELARGLPILGQFIKGWDGIKEAITGANEAVRKIDEESAAVDRVTAAWKAYLAGRKAIDDFVNNQKKDLEYEGTLLSMPEGVAKEQFRIEHEKIKAKEDAYKKIEALAEKETAKQKEELEKQEKELNDWFAKQKERFDGNVGADSSKGISELSISENGSQQYQQYLEEAKTKLAQLNSQKKALEDDLNKRITEGKSKSDADIDRLSEIKNQSVVKKALWDEEVAADKKRQDEYDKWFEEDKAQKRALWNETLEADKEREKAYEDWFEKQSQKEKEIAKDRQRAVDEILKVMEDEQRKEAKKKADANEMKYSSAEVRRSSFSVLNNTPKADLQLEEAKKANSYLADIVKSVSEPAYSILSIAGL